MNMEISVLKERDYEEFIAFSEESFTHTKNFFQIYYPHVRRKDTIDWNNSFIIKEKGKIVSHVGIFPLQVEADGVNLKVGGIGGVATLPDYRGKGYMSELLKYSIEKMKKEGYSLSWLAGDRQRYRYKIFGYEMAGRLVNFTISETSLRKTLDAGEIELVRYRGERELLVRIMACHEKEPLKTKRSKRDYELLMDRTGILTYLGKRDGKWAYVTCEGNTLSSRLIEIGGDASVLTSMFISLMKKINQPLSILYPEYHNEIFSFLMRISLSWQKSPHCMLKILNLPELLEAFVPQIEEKCKGNNFLKGYSVVLGMKDSKQYVSLEVGEKIRVSETLKGELIALSDTEMVSLLFGPFDSSTILDRPHPILGTIFPLNLYIWPLDSV
jgi:predicted acetyltransferase